MGRSGGGGGAGGGVFHFEEAERGVLVGHQHVEESAAQRAEDRLGLVLAAGHAHYLGDAREIGEFYPDPASVNGQVYHAAGRIEELAENVTYDAQVAQQAHIVGGQVSHLDVGRVGGRSADAHDRLVDVTRLLEHLLD